MPANLAFLIVLAKPLMVFINKINAGITIMEITLEIAHAYHG